MLASRYIGRFLMAAIIIFTVFFFVTVGLIHAARAADWGPIPGPGEFSCSSYWIDPDLQANVTANSHVDGVTATQTVLYDGNATHRANFTWTDAQAAQLAIPGAHDVGADFTWDIGTGTTTLSDSLTCTEIPPTTTTTPPPTTTECLYGCGQTTTTVVPPPAASPPADCDATPTPGGCLPHTGSDSSAPLAIGGAGLVGLGAAAGAIAGLRKRSVR